MFTSNESMHMLIMVRQAIRRQTRLVASADNADDRAFQLQMLETFAGLEQKLEELDERNMRERQNVAVVKAR